MADELVASYSERLFPIRNGFVIHLFLKTKDFVSASKALHEVISDNGNGGICTLDGVTLKLRRLVKDFKSKKERKRDFPKLEKLLAEEFIIPKLGIKKTAPAPTTLPTVATTDSVPLPTLRGDCEKCPVLRRDSVTLKKTLKEKYSALRKEKLALSKNLNQRRVTFKLSRKDASISKQKTEVALLKREVAFLQRRVRTLEGFQIQDTSSMLRKEKQKRRNVQIALNKANHTIDELRLIVEKEKLFSREMSNRCAVMAEEMEKDGDGESRKKSYSREMRLAVYKCLLSNVPVEKTGELIIFLNDIFNGKCLKSAPGPSTVSRMAYELSVLSDIQAAEAMMLSSCTTLAWDATSIDGTHVNEVHVTTCNGNTVYLQVGHLPGGKREDYLAHITSTIKTIAETYALYSGQETPDILERIHSGISCTLTDRAAVNHCVVEELSLLLNKELVELNCNVHPLDGLASHTRKVLRQRDQLLGTSSSVFGSDCRVANFIYCISKLRYKAGKGDPCGFKLFLDKTGLSQGVIPRYVGNRLHILFHSAGIIFHMKEDLTTYLQKYCTASQLRVALLGDFKNPDLVTQLRVLGLFGKIVTGPWMTLFYKNPNKLKHLEMGPYLRRCLARLQHLKDNPAEIVSMDMCAFGRDLGADDNVLQSLQRDTSTDVLCDIVSCVSSGMLTVLSRQLHRYLEGPLSNPTPALLEQTASAPLNNISGERVLGSFDALFRKAPNSTVGFLDSKVKASMNNTLSYVMSKGELVQIQLLKLATTRAPTMRLQQRNRRLDNINAAHQRQISLAQQRDRSARKKVEKEVKAWILSGNTEAILDKIDHAAHPFISSVLKAEIPVDPSFLHVWDVDGEDVPFQGEVQQFKVVRKICNVVVTYQGSGTSFIPLSEFVTDTIMGDLVPGPGGHV